MAYFAESIWLGEQLLLNWEMMFVMVARSGQVWQLSQLSEPTYSCRILFKLKNETENQQNIPTTDDEPGALEEYKSYDLLSYDDEESDYEPDEL